MPVTQFSGVSMVASGASVTAATYPQIVQQFLAAQAQLVFNKYPGAAHCYLSSNACTDTNGTIKATTGQPVLRINDTLSGNYAWQPTSPPSKAADGSVLFSSQWMNISTPAWGVSDSTVTIVGCTPNGVSATAMAVVAPAARNVASTFSRTGTVMFTSGTTVTAEWCSDTPTDYVSAATMTGTFASARVFTARKNANTGTMRINGITTGTAVDLTGLTASTADQGYIGRQYVNDPQPFIGNLYCVILIKGVISDADLLTLEQYAASITPTAFSL